MKNYHEMPAIITCSASRLGFATAKRLANEGGG